MIGSITLTTLIQEIDKSEIELIKERQKIREELIRLRDKLNISIVKDDE